MFFPIKRYKVKCVTKKHYNAVPQQMSRHHDKNGHAIVLLYVKNTPKFICRSYDTLNLCYSFSTAVQQTITMKGNTKRRLHVKKYPISLSSPIICSGSMSRSEPPTWTMLMRSTVIGTFRFHVVKLFFTLCPILFYSSLNYSDFSSKRVILIIWTTWSVFGVLLMWWNLKFSKRQPVDRFRSDDQRM